MTDATVSRSCLVIAPHPDDEMLGAGVTIMRKVDAGTDVHLLVVTDGGDYPRGDPVEVAARRRQELQTACGILGLPEQDVTHLAIAETALGDSIPELEAAIAELVAQLEPDDVLVTADRDPHDHHAWASAATGRALTGRDIRILSYPIWQWRRPGEILRMLKTSGRPELVSTDGYLDRKRAGMAAYPSQELSDPVFAPFLGRYEVFFPVSP